MFTILGIVAVVVTVGIWLSGSPASVRRVRLDEIRVQHLQETESSIFSYWQNKRELPSSLSDVTSIGYGRMVVDPETGKAYDYVMGSTTTTFRLCATFITSSTYDSPRSYPIYGPTGFATDIYWDHPAGYHCFDRSFDPATLPPLSIINPPPAIVK